MDYIKSLQALHCRAGRLIFNLPRDTPSDVKVLYGTHTMGLDL